MSSSKDNVTPSTVSTSVERLLGRVKWFNSKAGYGFITVTDGQHSGSDIFVHHSAVNVENQQYRYLVQGEYVEFSLVSTPSGNHEFQASAVCGVKSGRLMCETRRDFKIARNNYRTSAPNLSHNNSNHDNVNASFDNHDIDMPRQQRPPRPQRTNAPRVRGNGPRDENNKEWTLVSKDNRTPNIVPQSQPQTSRQTDISRPRRGRPTKQQVLA